MRKLVSLASAKICSEPVSEKEIGWQVIAALNVFFSRGRLNRGLAIALVGW
jgi:hypothetical protein